MRAGLILPILLASCALLPACGSRSAARTGTATGALSPGAPGWARSGDRRSADGALFVCEGAGPTEELAQQAALGACSAKICELCGVEVKATVTTRETLSKIDIERKVVETCRRVRKGAEVIRSKQLSCGSSGCTSWVEVLFSTEAEARACKAYADGNFADSADCERLIDQFSRTPGLDAASFRTRTALLDRAIIACAEIDVRPTPKLTALDEIVWQGVLAPRNPPWERSPDDPGKPLSDRVRVRRTNQIASCTRDHEQRTYQPIDRQRLLVTKVFVDRLAIVRDAMHAYATIMAVIERTYEVHYFVGREPDSRALVTAMRELIPFGKHSKIALYSWVREFLSSHGHAWVFAGMSPKERHVPTLPDLPELKDYLVKTNPPPWPAEERVQFAELFAADGKVTDQEWSLLLQGAPCAYCLKPVIFIRDHGSDDKRLSRIVEAVNKTYASDREHVAGLVELLDGDWLLRLEPKLAPEVFTALCTWNNLTWFLKRLALRGTNANDDRIRKRLVALMARRLEHAMAEESCDELHDKLGLLETEGESTRRFEAAVCRCFTDAKEPRNVGHMGGLYLRLIEWGASCVPKGNPP